MNLNHKEVETIISTNRVAGIFREVERLQYKDEKILTQRISAPRNSVICMFVYSVYVRVGLDIIFTFLFRLFYGQGRCREVQPGILPLRLLEAKVMTTEQQQHLVAYGSFNLHYNITWQ